MLSKAKFGCTDGTFACTAVLFLINQKTPYDQTLTIHIYFVDQVGNVKSVPVVFMLLTDKKESTYILVFKVIMNLLEKMNLTTEYMNFLEIMKKVYQMLLI